MSILTLPSSSELISGISGYSSGLFSELLPVGLMIAGVIIGVLFVRFIGKSLLNAVSRMTGKGKAGAKRGLRRI
jgi:hypothetical protein